MNNSQSSHRGEPAPNQTPSEADLTHSIFPADDDDDDGPGTAGESVTPRHEPKLVVEDTSRHDGQKLA